MYLVLRIVHAKVSTGMLHKHVVLSKRPRIQQQLDPLSSRQLTLLNRHVYNVWSHSHTCTNASACTDAYIGLPYHCLVYSYYRHLLKYTILFISALYVDIQYPHSLVLFVNPLLASSEKRAPLLLLQLTGRLQDVATLPCCCSWSAQPRQPCRSRQTASSKKHRHPACAAYRVHRVKGQTVDVGLVRFK